MFAHGVTRTRGYLATGLSVNTFPAIEEGTIDLRTRQIENSSAPNGRNALSKRPSFDANQGHGSP